MRQGQSVFTQFKQERFHPILRQSLRISQAPKVVGYPYYHVDLNAGSGFNGEVGVEGSPLNFIRAAENENRLNFFAFFIDHDGDAVEELTQRAEFQTHTDRVGIFQGDNQEVLDVIREFIRKRENKPQYAMGTILIDPNGYHDGVPWEQLNEFTAEFTRFDIVANLNTRTWRLERPHIQEGNGRWGTKQLRPISSFPHIFNRPNWMITHELQMCGSSWIQVVGRSIETSSRDYRRIGFYDLAGAIGREIIEGLENGGSRLQLQLLP